jgi:hypothetical protein
MVRSVIVRSVIVRSVIVRSVIVRSVVVARFAGSRVAICGPPELERVVGERIEKPPTKWTVRARGDESGRA